MDACALQIRNQAQKRKVDRVVPHGVDEWKIPWHRTEGRASSDVGQCNRRKLQNVLPHDSPDKWLGKYLHKYLLQRSLLIRHVAKTARQGVHKFAWRGSPLAQSLIGRSPIPPLGLLSQYFYCFLWLRFISLGWENHIQSD